MEKIQQSEENQKQSNLNVMNLLQRKVTIKMFRF